MDLFAEEFNVKQPDHFDWMKTSLIELASSSSEYKFSFKQKFIYIHLVWAKDIDIFNLRIFELIVRIYFFRILGLGVHL